jgi:hypothetical protein
MKIDAIEVIYNNLLLKFSDTLKKTSEDINKTTADKYMTLCEKVVINLDVLKNEFVKNMALTTAPMSCDALYLTSQNELFMIEFKNGVIKAKKSYEIKVKIFESLLMLSEKFSRTIDFMRNNLIFILVYNENVKHGPVQFEDTGINKIQGTLFNLAHIRKIRFGLHRFKKLYFKNVFTYSKAEFESEFVAKYCT